MLTGFKAFKNNSNMLDDIYGQKYVEYYGTTLNSYKLSLNTIITNYGTTKKK